MMIFSSLVRATHIASCMLLQGNLVFRLFIVQPVFTHAKEDVRLTAVGQLEERLRKLTAWSFALGLFSGCLWICSVAVGISGVNSILALQPETFRLLLGRTQFGLLWEVRLMLAAGFIVLFFLRGQWSQLLQLLLAVAMLVSLSIGGHAGAAIGERHWIHVGDDAFHLLAAGIWPAGLAPFAIFLTQVLHLRQLENVQNAALITQRFSSVSLVTVSALTITGLINGYFLVGTIHGLITTIYGRLLLLKLSVFAGMVMIGAVNLFWVKPRIVMAAQSARMEKSLNLLRSLRRNVLAELFLGAVLMMVVGVLGVTPPAAHSDMPNSSDVQRPDNGALNELWHEN